MTSLPAPQSPIIDKINAHMAKKGVGPVRYSMRDGRAQFWVVVEDQTVAASSAWNLMRALKLDEAAPPAKRDPKWISVARAEKLSGFSRTTLHRFAKLGQIESAGKRPRWFNPASVERWAEQQRVAENPRLHPRRRRKHHVMPTSATPRRVVAAPVTGGLKIERGVPIPPKRGAVTAYSVWSQMKVGDSFFVPGKKFPPPPHNVRKVMKFTSRKLTERGVAGVRIWRVK